MTISCIYVTVWPTNNSEVKQVLDSANEMEYDGIVLDFGETEEDSYSHSICDLFMDQAGVEVQYRDENRNVTYSSDVSLRVTLQRQWLC